MASFGLVVDSTCSLPDEITRMENVAVIPVHVSFGEREFRDGVDLTRPEFYRLLSSERSTPVTSAPSIGECLEVYERALNESEELLVLTLASDLSATYNAASAAARMAKGNVRVVDSRTVAGGHALLATACLRARADGLSLKETSELAEELRSRVRFFAYIHTLEYLRRSGRATALQAWFASLLQIKVLVRIANGRIEPISRVRTRVAGIDQLKRLTEAAVGPQRQARICVMHANAPTMGEELAQWARTAFSCSELYSEEIGPALAARAGPGVLAVSVIGESPG